MDLTILPALESDVERMMEIQFLAFDGDPFHNALYPGGNKPPVRRTAEEQMLKGWRESHTTYIKCVTNGTILGWALWKLYKDERPESEWNVPETVEWLKGRQRESAESFLNAIGDMRKQRWGGKPYCLCAILCVDPKYQRRGAGTALMSWGLDQAKQLGLPAYLEASKQGFHLYTKLGFRQIDLVVVPAEKWDGPHAEELRAMLFSP